MKLITLSGCCCLDLKTGTLCIGVVFMIGQIVSMLQSFIRHLNFKCAADIDPHACKRTSSIEMAITIIGNLLFFTVTALMICGSNKKKQKLLIPYLVFRGTAIVIIFFAVWYLGIKLLFTTIAWGVITLLFGNAFICLELYFWLVVNSRRQELIDEEE
ncbi:uncharacterized protein LOC103572733 [Microplitis demolitor]|uniref:uncharacterized protein LOC103572733 n=1 Tax=Microplitis demolitor TaxID=69319 RepID=UPI0004CD4F6C|nr:uncharacterized protein LOC103572733 [Microplitis demolitor]